jgi:adenosylmethionine-8-amino-7-oxononanoate aminotransferase
MDDLLQKDRNYVWHPFTQMQTAPDPLVIVKAEKATLFAADGKEYLDCNSSWWVTLHGHNDPHLKQALINQFEEIDHVIFAGATHPKAIELAERVVRLLPNNFQKVFFSDDGSTSVEVAIKMVFQYWHNQSIDKKRIVALEGAYHGDTFGAMSISQRGYFNAPFEHLFFEVDYLPFPTQQREEEVLIAAEKLFSSNECAAIILEPLVQGSAGMMMYRPEFLERLVALAKANQVLVIFDEVMTGWGRTGNLFAMNYIDSTPDIVCLSKGLTGGVLPLGLTVATEAIYNAFLSPIKTKALLHGHSFTGNALACAVACANIDLIENTAFKDNIKRISEHHAAFGESLKAHLKVQEERQIGTIIAVEIKVSGSSSYFAGIRDVAYEYFISNGLLIRPLGNVVFLNPPYCVTNEELSRMYEGISGLLNHLE